MIQYELTNADDGAKMLAGLKERFALAFAKGKIVVVKHTLKHQPVQNFEGNAIDAIYTGEGSFTFEIPDLR